MVGDKSAEPHRIVHLSYGVLSPSPPPGVRDQYGVVREFNNKNTNMQLNSVFSWKKSHL